MRTTLIAVAAFACAACATKNDANRPDSSAPAAATVAPGGPTPASAAELRHYADSLQKRYIEAATKGRVVTQLYEGERRFDVAVRLVQDGDPITGLRNLTISAPSGERIPVTQLAEFIKTDGVAEILREGNVRRLAVKWSVRDRDMGSLVTEAMRKVGASVRLPEGYRMVWSGRFEDQQRALARLYIIVPLVLFIIFVLLFGAFQSVGDTLLIMLNLPFALIGGTLALYLWRTNFNISAAVGYIAVFGVSVLNGVVLLSSIRRARQEGFSRPRL